MPCVTLSPLLFKSDGTVAVRLPENGLFSPPDNAICHLLSSHDTGTADPVHSRRTKQEAGSEPMINVAADISLHSYSLGPRCDRGWRPIPSFVDESLCPKASLWSWSPCTW